MIKMTLEEFHDFLREDGWVHCQEISIVETDTYQEATEVVDGEPVFEEISHTHGNAWIASEKSGVTLTVNTGFQFNEYNPDSFEAWHDECIEIVGLQIIDEDGEDFGNASSEPFNALPSEFVDIDFTEIHEKLNTTTDIDLDKDLSMEIITLDVDNAPNIRFQGELIGSASSSANNAAGSSYSGETGRWAELSLYKTQGGKFVAHKIGRTQWQGERDRFSAQVCENEADVIAFFGHRWLAKELYEDAGISDAVTID